MRYAVRCRLRFSLAENCSNYDIDAEIWWCRPYVGLPETNRALCHDHSASYKRSHDAALEQTKSQPSTLGQYSDDDRYTGHEAEHQSDSVVWILSLWNGICTDANTISESSAHPDNQNWEHFGR